MKLKIINNTPRRNPSPISSSPNTMYKVREKERESTCFEPLWLPLLNVMNN